MHPWQDWPMPPAAKGQCPPQQMSALCLSRVVLSALCSQTAAVRPKQPLRLEQLFRLKARENPGPGGPVQVGPRLMLHPAGPAGKALPPCLELLPASTFWAGPHRQRLRRPRPSTRPFTDGGPLVNLSGWQPPHCHQSSTCFLYALRIKNRQSFDHAAMAATWTFWTMPAFPSSVCKVQLSWIGEKLSVDLNIKHNKQDKVQVML